MTGIIIVAHGALGETLIQCAAHVLGKRPEGVRHISVVGRNDPDVLLANTRKLIDEMDDGDGVLLLTDMIGGTPSNVATRALEPGRVEGLAGVNLPMLVRALTYRHAALAVVLAKAQSGGHEGVTRLSSDAAGATTGS